MILRNGKTLFFTDKSDAERRAELWRHDGNYEGILVFSVLGGENTGKWCVHATELTHKKDEN